jgi:hypothetical protein
MISNFYLEDFYAFSSDVAGACTYGSDDSRKVRKTEPEYRLFQRRRANAGPTFERTYEAQALFEGFLLLSA